jgi:probable rRNA maturation factor
MILNRQRTVPVARPPLEIFLRRVRQHLGLAGAELTICMVSDAEIARMNESFRKKKGPTDVLSFPAIARRKPRVSGSRPVRAPGSRGAMLIRQRSVVPKRAGTQPARATQPHFLGDIAISPATARRNAKIYHRTLPQELQILILHGVLHLLGYDHEADRGQMTRVENRLRRKLGLA